MGMKIRLWVIATVTAITASFMSCQPNNKKLDFALEYAGKNRAELEKVLLHYKGNPLKEKATRFLIENMPWHFSLKYNKTLVNYYDELDELLINTPVIDYRDSKNIEKYIDDHMPRDINISSLLVHDIHHIKADYLIDNIDRAFECWQEQPWAQHVGFDDFCEYLLPYHVGNSFMMEDWRTKVYEHIDESIKNELRMFSNSSELRNSAYWACKTINKYLRKTICPDGSSLKSPSVYRLSTLAKVPYGTCSDRTYVAAAVMRSFGIPVVIDFTYQWPFRSLGHEWNVLLMTHGVNVSFGGGEEGPGELHMPGQRMAKVFRNTYAANDELLNLRAEMKTVPSAFRNVLVKDVTKEYMETHNIRVPIARKQHHAPGYAYLAVFNDKEWIPVCYGKKKGNSYVFEEIGNDAVYLPVYYDEGGISPFADPFILDLRGDMHYLAPYEDQTQDVMLYRKFGLSKVMYNYAGELINGEIQASAEADFSHPYVVHKIAKWSTTSDSVCLDTPLRYRYWRYLGYPASNNIAELAFYASESPSPQKGRVIGTDETYFPGDTVHTRYSVFDGDPLTYYEVPNEVQQWVGLDMGEPVDIDKVIYTPRNDDNDIRQGDIYELFYWGNGKWASLGRKTGIPPCMHYQAAPVNALFLLRDLTRGKEERIFTYENGRQVWW
jgi:hypothetical protein